MMPNAGAHLLPAAGATQERTLEAVRCSALLAPDLPDTQRALTLLNNPLQCLLREGV
jgi:hypothetical protein